MNIYADNMSDMICFAASKRRKVQGALLCGAIGLLLTGCHTTQRTGVSKAELKAESERYEAALQQALTAESCQQKVTLSMGSTSLKGSLKMHRGKDLLLSVNAPLLGFEIARVEATADSVWLVDKFDKVYVALSIADMSRSIGGDVDLEALQCLLTGRIYVPGRGAAGNSDFKRFSWSTSGDDLIGSYTANGRYTLIYTIDGDNRLAKTTVALADSSSVASWSYGSYTTDGSWCYPTRQTISFVKGEKTVNGSMTLGAPTVPAATWSHFASPSSYKQVDVPQLVETLKKAKN
jgi:outer membrane biogenesis lipoprotein LolB